MTQPRRRRHRRFARASGARARMALARGGWSVAIGYRSNEADAKETVAAVEARRDARPRRLPRHHRRGDRCTEAFRRVARRARPGHAVWSTTPGCRKDGLLLKYSMETYDRVDGDERARRVPVLAGGPAGDAAGEVGPHREHVLGRRAARQRRSDGLRGFEDRRCVGLTTSLAREVGGKGHHRERRLSRAWSTPT